MQALQACIRFFYKASGWISHPFLKIKNLQIRAAMITLAITSIVWLIAALVIPLAPFGDNSLCTNDGYAQYMPFLSEFWSICHGEGSFLYSFRGALGSNFYLTMAYYLFSPFTFLVLLFDKAQIPAAANLIIILKNILVACVMAWYLAGKGKKPLPFLASACAIAYGFSFYFLGYAVNFMWMDSIALVPLMLWGMERIGTPKGRVFYLLSLAGAVLMNFYMGAIICIFLALYYVLASWTWSKKGWMETGWFALCSLCAVAIAGIVLIPVVQGMLMANSSRMSPPSFEIFNDFRYFVSRLLPDAEVIRITHNRGTINLYMGTAVLFGSILFLLSKGVKWRTKLALLGLCLLYLASTQISWLNYAFHGFYLQRQVPNRYGFLVSLLGAIMMYYGFLSLNKDKFWKIGAAGCISAVYFAAAASWSDPDHLWLAFLLPGVVILYLIAAIFRKRSIAAGLVILESLCGLAMLAPGSMDSSYTDMARYIAAGRQTPGGRGEIVCSDIANAPMLYGMNGVSAFNSVINPKTANMLGKLGFAAGENYYRFFGFDPISALFFNVRSIVSDMSDLLPYPYEQTALIEDLAVWTSPYEIPLGICLEDPDALMSNTNKFDNNNVLYPGAFQTIAVSGTLSGDAQYGSDPDHPYKVTDIEENDVTTLTLEPMIEDNLYVYAALSGTKEFTVHKNGQILADNKYEGNIVYLGDVTETDIITFEFKADSDQEEETLKLQAALLPPEKSAAAAQSFIDNGLKDQTVVKNTISGTFTSDRERTMIFTLPYDSGWTATVNGQKIETAPWQNALVSIQLPAGESQIHLVYIPAGLKGGIWLSAAGIIGAILILCWPLVARRISQKNRTALAKSGPKTMEKPKAAENADQPKIGKSLDRPVAFQKNEACLAQSENPASKLPASISSEKDKQTDLPVQKDLRESDPLSSSEPASLSENEVHPDPENSDMDADQSQADRFENPDQPVNQPLDHSAASGLPEKVMNSGPISNPPGSLPGESGDFPDQPGEGPDKALDSIEHADQAALDPGFDGLELPLETFEKTQSEQ